MSQVGNPQSANALSAPIDESGRIAADLPCSRCTYNLRTLAMDGRCPECDLPVKRSVRGNLLRSCDPVWLDKMNRGASWLAAGIGIETITSLLRVVIGFFVWFGVIGTGLAEAAPSTVHTAARHGVPPAIGLLGMVPLALGMITLVGFWKTTSPEFTPLRGGLFSVRPVVCLAYLAQCLLNAITVSLVLTSDAAINQAPRMASALSAIANVVAAFAYSTALIYGCRIARRIPDRKLVVRTVLLLFAMAVFALLTCVLYVLTESFMGKLTPTTSGYDYSAGGMVVMFGSLYVGGAGAVISAIAVLFARMEGFFLVLSFRKAFIEASRL